MTKFMEKGGLEVMATWLDPDVWSLITKSPLAAKLERRALLFVKRLPIRKTHIRCSRIIEVLEKIGCLSKDSKIVEVSKKLLIKFSLMLGETEDKSSFHHEFLLGLRIKSNSSKSSGTP